MWSVLLRKLAYFSGAGALGGLVAGGVIYAIPEPAGDSRLLLVLVSLSVAIIAGTVCGGLSWAASTYFRLPAAAGRKPLIHVAIATVAGALCGLGLQALYTTPAVPAGVLEFVLKPLLWGLLAMVVVCPICSRVPNARGGAAASWSFAAGVVAGLLYFIPALLIPDPLGSVLGVGVLGLGMGASIALTDLRAGLANVVVCWPAGSQTLFALGPDPIYIGGGQDHIWLPGLKARSGAIVSTNGYVKYLDPGTGKQQDMRNLSKLKVGGVELIVHTLQ